MYLGRKDPGTAWSLRSRALAEGLALYEESINELGFPLREAYDPERDGWYEVNDETVDYSIAALEEYRKNQKNPEAGVQLRVVDTYEEEAERPAAARRPAAPRGSDESLDNVGPGLEGTRDLSG